jgi:chaperonin GroEL (HSP60 family)
MDGDVANMMDLNVIDPLKVKTNAIESAAETAIMILRIDDIIAAGAMGGRGGLPDMD